MKKQERPRHLKRADRRLRYAIRLLLGEKLDCPVWMALKETKKDLEWFKAQGYDWHHGILNYHYRVFRKQIMDYRESSGSPELDYLDLPISELFKGGEKGV